jgi:alanine racemase
MPLFRPTICEINANALRHNYRQLKKLAGGREVVGVVKANAYGHGAVAVSRILASEGVRLFAVASVEEGIELRRSGLTGRIFCFGGTLGAAAQDFQEFGIEPIVFEEESVKLLAQQMQHSKEPLSIHLKVDTGMGRLGVLLENLPALLKVIAQSPALKLESVMTHLARAEEEDQIPTDRQFENFRKVELLLEQSGYKIPVLHLCNSAALIDQKLNESGWVRPGLALYGAYPHERFKSKLDLKPVMSWKTRIISLKNFPSGSPLSYGGTFITQRSSKIAVVPVGYADGYFRAFSNKGLMLLRGKRVPVVGRVCMDLTLLDVTDLPVVELGDEVVILGSQNGESLRAEEVATMIQTIPYEIFCGVSARVPRLMVSSGEVSDE